MKLKDFTDNTQYPKLARATVRQFGDFAEFAERAGDITSYGAAGGWGGFTYHSDTVPFAERNRDLILEMAEDMADDLGEGLVTMIRNFGCLKSGGRHAGEPEYSESEVMRAIYDKKSEDHTQIMNALAWFALEEVARSYEDMAETE